VSLLRALPESRTPTPTDVERAAATLPATRFRPDLTPTATKLYATLLRSDNPLGRTELINRAGISASSYDRRLDDVRELEQRPCRPHRRPPTVDHRRDDRLHTSRCHSTFDPAGDTAAPNPPRRQHRLANTTAHQPRPHSPVHTTHPDDDERHQTSSEPTPTRTARRTRHTPRRIAHRPPSRPYNDRPTPPPNRPAQHTTTPLEPAG